MLKWKSITAHLQAQRRGVFGCWHSGLGVHLGSAMFIFGLLSISSAHLLPPSPLTIILLGATVVSAIGFLLDMIVATIRIVVSGEPEERMRSDTPRQ